MGGGRRAGQRRGEARGVVEERDVGGAEGFVDYKVVEFVVLC